MNILFIGPYRQHDEWGRKSRGVLKALQSMTHSVTSRPIFLSSDLNHNAYTEMGECSLANQYDVLIQFILPPYGIYDGRFAKRIGIFNTETLLHQVPRGYLNMESLMDEIWTDSFSMQKQLQQNLDRYNIPTKVRAMPPSFDIANHKLDSATTLNDPDLQDKFIFYFMGDVLDSKSAFRETCTAYLTMFTAKDDVALLVVPENPVSEADLTTAIDDCRQAIGKDRPTRNQPLLKIMTNLNMTSTEHRNVIHKAADCMVSPGYSLATSSLVIEGALHQSTPIVNMGNACYEWWGEEQLWGVDSYEDFCLMSQRPLAFRFTVNESWHRPTIKALGYVMKEAYVNKFERDKKRMANKNIMSILTTNQLFQDACHNSLEGCNDTSS